MLWIAVCWTKFVFGVDTNILKVVEKYEGTPCTYILCCPGLGKQNMWIISKFVLSIIVNGFYFLHKYQFWYRYRVIPLIYLALSIALSSRDLLEAIWLHFNHNCQKYVSLMQLINMLLLSKLLVFPAKSENVWMNGWTWFYWDLTNFHV